MEVLLTKRERLAAELSQELRGTYIWIRKKSVILVRATNVTVKNVHANVMKRH
jgi:translation initiation factor IF-1